jgi:hypothetical protein
MTDNPKDRPEPEIGDGTLAADSTAADPGPADLEADPGSPDPEAAALDLDAAVGSSDFEAGGEAAEDLNASELEAAASGAESEVESEEGGAALDEIGGAEAGDQLIEGDETETAIEAPPALAPGSGNLERRIARPGARAPRGPKPARTVFAVDPALRIKDPVSAAFVVGTVLVFVLILANALAFGHGGAFTPLPTPTPIATTAPAPSTGPSGSPGASGSPAASPSIAPSASPSVTPSPAAS